MQKDSTLWAILVVGALIAAGSIWYAANSTGEVSEYGTSSTVTNTTSTTKTTTTKKPAAKTTGTSINAVAVGVDSISHLTTLALNYKCSITTSNSSRVGTMYIAGTKVRADLKSLVGGKSLSVTMIDTGEYLYTWGSTDPSILRLSAALSANGSIVANHGGIDPATPISYQCNVWAPDMSMFAPPSNLYFVDSTGARVY